MYIYKGKNEEKHQRPSELNYDLSTLDINLHTELAKNSKMLIFLAVIWTNQETNCS